MSDSGNIAILFHSNNHVFWAQDILKEQGIPHRIVPVPRHLSSDCGYCIRADASQRTTIAALMKAESIDVDRIVDQAFRRI